MRVQGIDVAFYEPVIDWEKVQKGGYKFAFIKCSQRQYNDPKFKEHWKNSKLEGMPRGAYHFFQPTYKADTPEKQAEFFFNSLGNDLGELPFVIDLELYTSGYYHGSEFWYRYLDRLNVLSGGHPANIYTGFYYWNDNVFINSVKDIDYFKRYNLWIARYGVSYPFIPKPWLDWTFWQYGEDATIEGIYDELGRLTKCDVDYFNGDETEFQKYLLAQPGEPDPMADYIEIAPSVDGEYRSIRQQTAYPQTPHILGSKIGQINAGSTGRAGPSDYYVYTSDVIYNGTVQARQGDKWWKVFSANGTDIVGWAAEIHLGKVYLTTKLVSDTPNPSPSLPDLPFTVILGDDVTYSKQTIVGTLKAKV